MNNLQNNSFQHNSFFFLKGGQTIMATKKEIRQKRITKIKKLGQIMKDLEELRPLYDLNEGTEITQSYLALEKLLQEELLKAYLTSIITIKEGDQ